MTQNPIKQPTPAEWSILKVLWERGDSTVRQVHEELQKSRKIGGTTVLKLMQIMTEKGLIEKARDRRPQRFRAKLSRERSQKQFLLESLDRVFAGSAGKLVLHALSLEKASPEELHQIRELLDRLEDAESGEGQK
ncbi:MAG: BlaI/MecI/CopY family transcriptional regulator [Planctomycetota bacterium]|nr:MAG: BlaI/MecI/CopY family transcriptional regulator [Planctomycetota bacterium]